jgi:hypothetical protein
MSTADIFDPEDVIDVTDMDNPASESTLKLEKLMFQQRQMEHTIKYLQDQVMALGAAVQHKQVDTEFEDMKSLSGNRFVPLNVVIQPESLIPTPVVKAESVVPMTPAVQQTPPTPVVEADLVPITPAVQQTPPTPVLQADLVPITPAVQQTPPTLVVEAGSVPPTPAIPQQVSAPPTPAIPQQLSVPPTPAMQQQVSVPLTPAIPQQLSAPPTPAEMRIIQNSPPTPLNPGKATCICAACEQHQQEQPTKPRKRRAKVLFDPEQDAPSVC